MKIVYVVRGVGYYIVHDTVVAALCRAGHEVSLLFDRSRSEGRPEHALQAHLHEFPNLSMNYFPVRSDRWRRFLYAARELRSYTSYLLRTDQSRYYQDRWEGYLALPIRRLVSHSDFARRVFRSVPVRAALRLVEVFAPPDRGVVQFLAEQRADVVIASPLNMRFSEEVEYIKAAKKLGIPTLTMVYSWDNLTTKGLYHLIPDVVLAWNQAHFDEAHQIHHVPVERMVITGAPRFDEWFEAASLGQPRAEFCARVGLDATRPFFLYLGSSANIAKDETWLVKQLFDLLRAHPNPEMRAYQILARPHPANVKYYADIEQEGLRVWPKGRTAMDTSEFLQDFYNSLHHSKGTIGINTTGMIDAIINDLPCVTVITDTYRATQMQAVHFRQLLSADVLEVSQSPEACVSLLEGLHHGLDGKALQRKQFVRDYIRPRGLHRPVGEIVARCITLAAQRRSAREINAVLSAGRNENHEAV